MRLTLTASFLFLIALTTVVPITVTANPIESEPAAGAAPISCRGNYRVPVGDLIGAEQMLAKPMDCYQGDHPYCQTYAKYRKARIRLCNCALLHMSCHAYSNMAKAIRMECAKNGIAGGTWRLSPNMPCYLYIGS